MRFDTHALQNPEITGVEYQQGELMGYEVREYVLEKWKRHCAYCGKANVPLEIEHLTPRSRGGSDRVSNLTLACTPCNQKKGNRTAAEFGYPELQTKAKAPSKDAAAINSIRYREGGFSGRHGLTGRSLRAEREGAARMSTPRQAVTASVQPPGTPPR